MMQHVEMTLQRINRRNVGKTNRIGKESGSATVSATGLQRLPDKKPWQGVIISVKGQKLSAVDRKRLMMSLRSVFRYVPNTARNGHLLGVEPVYQWHFAGLLISELLYNLPLWPSGGLFWRQSWRRMQQQPSVTTVKSTLVSFWRHQKVKPGWSARRPKRRSWRWWQRRGSLSDKNLWSEE